MEEDDGQKWRLLMKQRTKAIFRECALAHGTPLLLGGVIVASTMGTKLVALSAVSLTVGLIAVLTFGTYERRERVPGFIMPTAGLVRVVAPRLGVVTSVQIADGDEVVAGQTLFSVSGLRGAAGGLDADAIQVEVLERERANVDARMLRESQLSEIRTSDARRRMAEMEGQARGIQQQKALARERVDLMNRELARLESLRANAHVSASMLDDRRGELLAAQQAMTSLAREFERLQADIAALEAELELIPLQLGARQDELYARLLEIERMLTEAEVQRDFVVRAPVAGRVTSLVAFPGQSVTPNQSVLAILPDDSQLQAVLLVPSHAAGFIQPGQQVRLRFDAFPHQRFGVYGGLVYSVSRTMLNPGDQVGPLLLQTPAYRVVARLDADSIMAYGESIPLQPDLTLQADIMRERMRIIEWIFDPIRAVVSAL
ncbi:MAG: HlyD family secretion protein [Wenzhouxiangella sp.]